MARSRNRHDRLWSTETINLKPCKSLMPMPFLSLMGANGMTKMTDRRKIRRSISIVNKACRRMAASCWHCSWRGGNKSLLECIHCQYRRQIAMMMMTTTMGRINVLRKSREKRRANEKKKTASQMICFMMKVSHKSDGGVIVLNNAIDR